MDRRKIILMASCMKPADAPRAHRFFRFLSAQQSPDYVFISVGTAPAIPSDSLISIGTWQRGVGARITRILKIMMSIAVLRPEKVIISSVELLPAAVLVKPFLRYQLSYDIQENTASNLRYGRRGWGRGMNAVWVTLIERCAMPFLDEVCYAEPCYPQEMPYIKKTAKYVPHTCVLTEHEEHQLAQYSRSQDSITLVLCGTIALGYGLEEAISLIDTLHALDPRYNLNIVGHVPDATTMNYLNKEVNYRSYIRMDVQQTPMSYDIIIENIIRSDIGLLPYPPNRAWDGRLGARQADFVACDKVVLNHLNETRKEALKSYTKAYTLDFKNSTNVAAVHAEITQIFC